MGRHSDTLKKADNPDALAGLIVVDTWLRNVDRFSPDGTRRNVSNVLLADFDAPRGKSTLVAMDFTHALTGGRGFGPEAWGIDAVRDQRLYGCFPEFRPHLRKTAIDHFVAKLGGFGMNEAHAAVGGVPPEWGLRNEHRAKLSAFPRAACRFLERTPRSTTPRALVARGR